MTPNIQEQLLAKGIVRVIVDLNTTSGVAQPLAAALGDGRRVNPLPHELAGDLEKHFVHSDAAQDNALARSLARAAVRREGRALPRTAALENTAAMASLAPQVQPPNKMRLYPNLGILLGTTDAKGIAALYADRRVHRVLGAPIPLIIRPVHTQAAAATAGPTWGLKRLGVPELWDAGHRGEGVVVGHLDTGVDGSHPAFKNNAIADFAEFDFLGHPVPGAKAHDSNTHGTHTAGTIVGRPVGSTAFGVAPQAQLASALVIEGGDVVARILGGLDWIAGKPEVRVLSMSLGLQGYHPDFLSVIQIIRAKGILPVLAVGNEGPGTSRSPGNYVEALSTGACDQTDQVAYFSSSQRFDRADNPLVPDAVAPGVGVISSVPGGGFASMDGTSMATPHLAGLAALLFGAKMGATVDQVEQALFDSCTLPPGMAPERGNRGIPDGPKALQLLLSAGAPGRVAVPGGAAPPPAQPPKPKPRKAHAGDGAPKGKKGRGHGKGKRRPRAPQTA